MMITRPQITEERLEEIRMMMAKDPQITRTQLSKRLCELWGWQFPNGQWKDISCRDLLRALDKAGKITLPAPQRAARRAGNRVVITHLQHDTTPVSGKLLEFLPLRIEEIRKNKKRLCEFKSVLDQYHYLGFDRMIGENMKYFVYSREEIPLACLLFGSAAWSCKDRDLYIGWNKQQRTQGLALLTNNVRFLVFPWVRIPHLASHVLSLITRRLPSDWISKYGHTLYAIETFVETPRFRGVCYQAANWIYVGRTLGRGRDGGHHHQIMPVKDIYLYPLHRNFRQKLMEGQA